MGNDPFDRLHFAPKEPGPQNWRLEGCKLNLFFVLYSILENYQLLICTQNFGNVKIPGFEKCGASFTHALSLQFRGPSAFRSIT